MSDTSYFIISVMVISFFISTFVCKKTGHFFKNFFLSALSGLSGLFLVNLLTQYTAVSIPVNYISISASSFLGIPGVIALVISQILI